MTRGRFFLRFGCLLALFSIFVALAVILLAGWLGLVRIPVHSAWAIPARVILFLLGFVFLVWIGRGLRRISAPAGDLLEAANRVAEGDYTARVAVQGPPEMRSVARAFNTMASRLQANDTQRRNLMADVTHDLRTPLTIIQGGLEGMLDGIYTADETQLKSLLEETQLLSRLVDDLRTLALTESGSLQLRKEPTDLALLIDETVAAFRPQAEAAGIRIEVTSPDDVPLLDLDPERMRQVLSNLIANALRYTSQGGQRQDRGPLGSAGLIQVRMDLVSASGSDRQETTAEYCRIEIADNGPGIKPEELEHIFDRFYKTRDSGGMGLGLTIARNLVTAHGGTIRASNNDGQGTLITIALPAAPG